MHGNNETQAALLLTTYLTKPEPKNLRPLTAREWTRLTSWLNERDLSPGALLMRDPAHLLSNWSDRDITLERVQYLLDRAGALALALEKWERAGLWVLTQSDSNYPTRLAEHLQAKSPPVLFGCGNQRLLQSGGIAVVGSRNASEDDLAYAAHLGREAAQQGFSIISGGARGIDAAAMRGALDARGTVIGVLADSLLRAATSAKYRQALMANDLVLISPYNPEAGFDAGNAMARNKYIYCLSDAAMVVTTSKDQGGTWAGAIENLKEGWTPLWVKPPVEPDSGSAELVRRGAHVLPAEGINFKALTDQPPASHPASLLGPSTDPEANSPASKPTPKQMSLPLGQA